MSESRRVRRQGGPEPGRPWLAAALNLLPLPLSLGYAYLDRPLRFFASAAARSAAGAVTWDYLARFLGLSDTAGYSLDALTWVLIVVPPVALLAATAWDGWWVAAALMKGEARREGLRGRRRRSGRGPLLILGALGLLALGALVRTGDAVSYSLLAVVATAGWLMWRRGLSRAPVDYRPPQEPEEPTEE